MNNTKRIPTIILIILICLNIGFIWGNSMQSAVESGALSSGVLEKIKPALEFFIGAGNAIDHLVRKLAHFTEFGALGTEIALLLILIRRVRLQAAVNCAFFGLTVALIDETIQIFTNRGSQVQDVWLDFAGFCAGMVLAAVVSALVVKIRTVINKGSLK